MKEIKMKQVAELIFPNFPTDVKKQNHNERSIQIGNLLYLIMMKSINRLLNLIG